MPVKPNLAGRFSQMRPKKVVVPTASAARQELLEADGTSAAVFTAEDSGASLPAWVAANGAQIEAQLRSRGAVLFRGFASVAAPEIRTLAEKLGTGPFHYQERTSPRNEVADRVYTSTEYPAHQEIFFHNESSYAASWPGRLLFYCAQPAAEGGGTPLVDVRAVFKRIPSELRRKFLDRGLAYTRFFGGPVGLGWREAFQQDTVESAAAWAQANGYQAEALEGARLRTRRVAPAMVARPGTGEPLWFNHAAFFHLSTLPTAVRDGLLAQVPDGQLPYQVAFADGTPIPDDEIAVVREAYRDAALHFEWRPGDLVLLDNMAVAHARRPYSGPRRVLASMTDLVHNHEASPLQPNDLEIRL